MSFKLYKHQEKMSKLTYKALRTKGSHILFQAPTGFGKSVNILERCDRAEGRVIVCVPTRKLAKQLSHTLASLDPAILPPGLRRGNPKTSKIILTTYQTLNSQLKKGFGTLGDGFVEVIVDEAHIGFNITDSANPPAGIANIYNAFWNTCRWVGFTATPITQSGYRLQGWDYTVSKYTTAWLIRRKWLADYKYSARPSIDMSNAKIQSTGDFSAEDVGTAALAHGAVSSVIKYWAEYTRNGEKKCMIFAASIEHAAKLAEAIPSVIVHSKLKEDLIEEAFGKFKRNEVRTIISVSMLTAGFDDSEVEVQILARGTASIRLALQMWGRVLRPHPDIPQVNIIDLAGVYESVGLLPDDKVDFNRTKTSEPREPELLMCPECYVPAHRAACERVKNEAAQTVEYYCSKCRALVDTQQMKSRVSKNYEETEVLVRINPLRKKLRRVKRTIMYKDTQYMDAIENLRSIFAPRTKPGWSYHISKNCAQNDPALAKKVLRAYMQQVLSAQEAWREIQKIIK